MQAFNCPSPHHLQQPVLRRFLEFAAALQEPAAVPNNCHDTIRVLHCADLCPSCVPQELRKASGQQLREVQVVQGEAVKQLQDEQQQAKRKEAQLKVRDLVDVDVALPGAGWTHSRLRCIPCWIITAHECGLPLRHPRLGCTSKGASGTLLSTICPLHLSFAG